MSERRPVLVDPAAPVTLEAMRRRDLRAVLAIERVVFPEPWSEGIFRAELSLRTGRSYRVARLGPVLAGYAGLMDTFDEGHITTIAVDPACQRRGVATVLLADLARRARVKGIRQLSLEVAVGNEGAQSLYRAFGFAPVGVRKRYYQKTGEDALVMWAYDIDRPEYAARLDALEAKVRQPS
jgi:ribosomal-protein-alanine N-acetyltransferase